LLPPNNKSVTSVATEESVSEQTLYNWRKQAKEKGQPVPGKNTSSDQWSHETKFAVVVETARYQSQVNITGAKIYSLSRLSSGNYNVFKAFKATNSKLKS
jgi:transposase